MLLRNRLFRREQPSRDAKKVYIFPEGRKREVHYFSYFRELDSRVDVIVHQLEATADNSPMGLCAAARRIFLCDSEEEMFKELLSGDEVWFVLDTENVHTDQKRQEQIIQLKEFCEDQNSKGSRVSWSVVQSNPCFEVWLCYHKEKSKPLFDGDEECKAWKNYANQLFSGGFSSKKHPLLLADAIQNASANHEEESPGVPSKGSTEVYLCGQSIYSLVKEKLQAIRAQQNISSLLK